MRFYELTFLLSPDLSEEEIVTFPQKISDFIIEKGGKPEKSSPAVQKALGYPIKKIKKASLITLHFYLEPEKIETLEKMLKSENQILRYLIMIKKVLREMPTKQRFLRKEKVAEIKEEKITKLKKVALKEIDEKIEEILKE